MTEVHDPGGAGRPIIRPDNAAHVTELARAGRGWITTVRWSPRGGALAVAGSTGIALFSADLHLRGALEGQEGHVKGAAVSPDGTRIASAASDMTIRIYDLRAAGAFETLRGHTDAVNAVAFSPDGGSLASVGGDLTVRLWDAPTGAERAAVTGHTDEILSVVYALGGRVVLSGGRDAAVNLWDSVSGAALGRLHHNDWVREIAVCPADPALIAVAVKDMQVHVWRLVEGTDGVTGQTLHALSAHVNGADSAAFSPDGALLATAGRDNHIKLWDMATGTQLATLEGHERPVLTLSFSPDGALLASGSGDNTVRLWGLPIA